MGRAVAVDVPRRRSSPDPCVGVGIRPLPNGFRDLMSPGALGNSRGKIHGTRWASLRATVSWRTAMGRSPRTYRQARAPHLPDLARLARAPSHIRSRCRVGAGPGAHVVLARTPEDAAARSRGRGSLGACPAGSSWQWSVSTSPAKAHTEGSTRFENCKITSLYKPAPIDSGDVFLVVHSFRCGSFRFVRRDRTGSRLHDGRGRWRGFGPRWRVGQP